MQPAAMHAIDGNNALNAIDARNLSKTYGKVLALDRLSFSVSAGEVFGFLGPNGAGKTTTIRLLLGLISPTSGGATLLGRDVTSGAAARQDVGYLPGALALWPRVSGHDTLATLEALSGRPAVWRSELLERLEFKDADLHRRVGGYSDGMRQKIGIVQALQCAPKLALLDEPTKGLDPLVQIACYEIIADAAKRGTTVFFSSHVLPEVERLCDRVAMLRAGRLMSVGSVADLRRALPRRVTIEFRDAAGVVDLARFGTVISRSGRHVELFVSVDRVPELAAGLANLPVVDLLIEPQTLEDAFLERYR